MSEVEQRIAVLETKQKGTDDDMTYIRTKLDVIHNLNIDSGKELSAIKEHLKTLNGKVASHEKRFGECRGDIKELDDKVDNNRLSLAKYGAVGVATGLSGSGIFIGILKLFGV